MDFEDAGHVFYTNQNLGANVSEEEFEDITPAESRKKFVEFIRNFRYREIYVYREQLRQRFRNKQYFLEVSVDDINSYEDLLNEKLQEHPKVCVFILVFVIDTTCLSLLIYMCVCVHDEHCLFLCIRYI